MGAKLINYSSNMTGDSLLDQIAFCARVSNPTNQNNKETAEKLIKYLIKHKHWSPFETVSACIEIKTTRDIGRQILRHRSFSFQEFSQRYAAVENDFIFREARFQDKKNRQNSIEVPNHPIADEWLEMQYEISNYAKILYHKALDSGIAKEQARAILPEGMTASTMYMHGTIRSWIHYIDLRTGPETQKEHRIIAKECAEALTEIFPMIQEFVH